MQRTRGQRYIRTLLGGTYSTRMVKKGKQAQKVLIMGEGLVAGVSSHGLAEREHVSGSFSRHPSLSPQPQTKMSVSLNPSNALGFRSIFFFYRFISNHLLIFFEPGPFNILVKRSLTITNHNPQPVAFKVKTTAPKVPSLSAVVDWLTFLYSAVLCAT